MVETNTEPYRTFDALMAKFDRKFGRFDNPTNKHDGLNEGDTSLVMKVSPGVDNQEDIRTDEKGSKELEKSVSKTNRAGYSRRRRTRRLAEEHQERQQAHP